MERVYLNIEYKQKEEAKKMGARWDAERKKWYATQDKIDSTDLKKYVVEPKRVYYRLPFKFKEQAKELGGRWCQEERKWWFDKTHKEFEDYFDYEIDEERYQTYKHHSKERQQKEIPYFDELKNGHLYI